jgi:hypothetical protein
VWKNVGVQVCALSFGTTRKNNGTHGMRSIGRAQRSWLVCAQHGYMLSHNNLVNGACKVLVRGGGVLNFGMVECVE